VAKSLPAVFLNAGFHVLERLVRRFGIAPDGLVMDWPNYARVTEAAEEVAQIRVKCAALVTFQTGTQRRV
jgi:hypothetical protein